jgi:hypothetical protein
MCSRYRLAYIMHLACLCLHATGATAVAWCLLLIHAAASLSCDTQILIFCWKYAALVGVWDANTGREVATLAAHGRLLQVDTIKHASKAIAGTSA